MSRLYGWLLLLGRTVCWMNQPISILPIDYKELYFIGWVRYLGTHLQLCLKILNYLIFSTVVWLDKWHGVVFAHLSYSAVLGTFVLYLVE